MRPDVPDAIETAIEMLDAAGAMLARLRAQRNRAIECLVAMHEPDEWESRMPLQPDVGAWTICSVLGVDPEDAEAYAAVHDFYCGAMFACSFARFWRLLLRFPEDKPSLAAPAAATADEALQAYLAGPRKPEEYQF